MFSKSAVKHARQARWISGLLCMTDITLMLDKYKLIAEISGYLEHVLTNSPEHARHTIDAEAKPKHPTKSAELIFFMVLVTYSKRLYRCSSCFKPSY